MGKIIVKRADGEVIKIDENEALGELKKIRDNEQKTRRSRKSRPDNSKRNNSFKNKKGRRERKIKKPWSKKLKKIAVLIKK